VTGRERIVAALDVPDLAAAAVLARKLDGHVGMLKVGLELFVAHRPSFMSHLLLSHLSQDNNRPELVQRLFEQHADKVQIAVASRYVETELYRVRGATGVGTPLDTRVRKGAATVTAGSEAATVTAGSEAASTGKSETEEVSGTNKRETKGVPRRGSRKALAKAAGQTMVVQSSLF